MPKNITDLQDQYDRTKQALVTVTAHLAIRLYESFVDGTEQSEIGNSLDLLRHTREATAPGDNRREKAYDNAVITINKRLTVPMRQSADAVNMIIRHWNEQSNG